MSIPIGIYSGPVPVLRIPYTNGSFNTLDDVDEGLVCLAQSAAAVPEAAVPSRFLTAALEFYCSAFEDPDLQQIELQSVDWANPQEAAATFKTDVLALISPEGSTLPSVFTPAVRSAIQSELQGGPFETEANETFDAYGQFMG